MKLSEALRIIEGRVISTDVDLETDVTTGGGANLMSDVLAFTHAGALLLTGLTNPQVVRTADMAAVQAIVFVRDKLPSTETVLLAEEKGIPLLASQYTLYETCGKLYKAGLPSCGLFEHSLRRWEQYFKSQESQP